MAADRPRAPKGLQTRGRTFWDSTLEQFELSDAELAVLLEACRTMDDLDRLAGVVAESGAMSVGSQGQPVVNPALTEARGQRTVLHRLLAALALPDPDGATIPTTATLRAKKAAATRWKDHDSSDQRRAGGE